MASELERCKRLGIDAPEPIPHPDDFIVDIRNETVRVQGPWTKEEKVEWDRLRGCKAAFQEQLVDLEKMLTKKSNQKIGPVLGSDDSSQYGMHLLSGDNPVVVSTSRVRVAEAAPAAPDAGP